MFWGSGEIRVIEARPVASRVAEPRMYGRESSKSPLMKVTVPVGAAPTEVLETVAVKVTSWPKTERDGPLSVVVVGVSTLPFQERAPPLILHRASKSIVLGELFTGRRFTDPPLTVQLWGAIIPRS